MSCFPFLFVTRVPDFRYSGRAELRGRREYPQIYIFKKTSRSLIIRRGMSSGPFRAVRILECTPNRFRLRLSRFTAVSIARRSSNERSVDPQCCSVKIRLILDHEDRRRSRSINDYNGRTDASRSLRTKSILVCPSILSVIIILIVIIIIIIVIIIIFIIIIIIRVPRDCSIEGALYVHELIVGSSIDPTNLAIVSAVVKNSLLFFFSFRLVCLVMDARVECRVFNTKVLFVLSIYRIYNYNIKRLFRKKNWYKKRAGWSKLASNDRAPRVSLLSYSPIYSLSLAFLFLRCKDRAGALSCDLSFSIPISISTRYTLAAKNNR